MRDTPVHDLLALNPNGPHSAGLTADVARAFAEMVRFLNDATLPAADYPGLAGPPDVYTVLGALTDGVYALDQLTGQLADYLTTELTAGQIAVTDGPYEGLSRHPAAPSPSTRGLSAARGFRLRPAGDDGPRPRPETDSGIGNLPEGRASLPSPKPFA